MRVSVPPSPAPWIIKLGGSILCTGEDGSVDTPMLRRIAALLGTLKHPFVLLHGTSPGCKQFAVQNDFVNGRISPNKRDVACRCLLMLRRLHLAVSDIMVSEGLPVVSLSPLSICNSWGEITRTALIRTLLQAGYVPFLHGDLIQSDEAGFTVCSSDTLAADIARHFSGGRLLFATDVAGVYRRDPRNFAEAALIQTLDADMLRKITARAAPTQDVSGAMPGKLAAAAASSAYVTGCNIFDGRSETAWRTLLSGSTRAGTYLPGTA